MVAALASAGMAMGANPKGGAQPPAVLRNVQPGKFNPDDYQGVTFSSVGPGGPIGIKPYGQRAKPSKVATSYRSAMRDAKRRSKARQR